MKLKKFNILLLTAVVSPVLTDYCIKDLKVQSPARMESNEEEAGFSGSSFTAKPDIVATLLTLGFSENAAKKACYYTGNYSADLAAAWIIENQDKNLDGPLEEDLEYESEEEFPEGVDLYKMVFVVNMELNMGVGKLAAQVAHAALGLHQVMVDDMDKHGTMLLSWSQFGSTKIVLKGENVAHLMGLMQEAQAARLPVYVVMDAGRTQIAAGSTTVVGIIGKLDEVDKITGKLKLL